ncbi:hypothetical protein [Actinocorallia libanotica]|uniref:Uncharacterized protein n=1 Tax=Actinocorallia libanotica TaxID=46162 RepID=A0ABP4CDK1_9ACTN
MTPCEHARAGASAEALIPWVPIHPDKPEAGWIITCLDLKHYALLPHAKGWHLIRALTRGGGTHITTDNEAKAWAAEVLKAKARITAPAWQAATEHQGARTLSAST